MRAIGWSGYLGGIVAACSSREALPPSDTAPSCESLLIEGGSSPPPELASVAESVWLVTEPKSPSPLVVNWADARVGGQPAQWRSHAGRSWLVSDASALSLDSASSSNVEGRMFSCKSQSVEGGSNGDTSTPYAAVPLAPYVGIHQGELTQVARFPDPATAWPDLRTSDLARFGAGFVAVARGPDGLRLLEFQSRSGTLAEMSHLATVMDDDFNDVVAIDERYLAIASRRFGLVIVDVGDPAAPRVVADNLPLVRPRDGHSVAVVGARVYLAQAPAVGTGAVVAFDVVNPERPREVWRWNAAPGEDAHDVALLGDTVYVSSLRGGITLLSVAGDLPGTVARRRNLAAHSAAFIDIGRERLLWSEEQLGGGLHVIDVTRQAGSVELRDARVATTYVPSAESASGVDQPFAASPHLATCRDGICYVAHYQLGVVVLDLRGEPPLPGLEPGRVLATYPTWAPSPVAETTWLRGAVAVELDGPFIYVADTELGVVVLRAPSSDEAERESEQR